MNIQTILIGVVIVVAGIYFSGRGDRWLDRNVWDVLRRLDAFLKEKGYGRKDDEGWAL